ncbi:MAG: hypothetical protein JNK72_09055 [Myxococcales bacterium]|nr:hypothetical protein [Myxococcales bacterium]
MLALGSVFFSCGAATGVRDPDAAGAADGGDAGAREGCFPPCLTALWSACGSPARCTGRYITAAPDNWRRCFASGLTVVARAPGGHSYRNGPRECGVFSTTSDTTSVTDTWRDAEGATAATVRRPFDSARWRVTCEGREFALDADGPRCVSDPWMAVYNPHRVVCGNAECPSPDR